MSLGLANLGDFRAICECFNYKQKENFTKVAEPGSLILEAKVEGGLVSGAHPQSSSEFTEPGSSSQTSSDWTVKATEEAHAEHSVKGEWRWGPLLEILTMSQELRGHKAMGEDRRMCPA